MRPLVSIIDVRKSFARFQALRGVSLDVAQGEVLCIIGASGSGKTTLLRCVNQLVLPDSGSIWVDGELAGFRAENGRLYRLPEREIARQRRTTGIVFPALHLFPHLSVLANLIRAGPGAAPQPCRGDAEAHELWPGRAGRQGGELSRPSRAASSSGWPSPRPWPCTPPDAVRRADQRPGPRTGWSEVLQVMKDLAPRKDDDRVTHDIGFAPRSRRPRRVHGSRRHRGIRKKRRPKFSARRGRTGPKPFSAVLS